MIPYIDIPPLPLIGELKIQPFGFLVFLALLAAYHTAIWHGRQKQQDLNKIGTLVVWVVVGAFVMAHVVSVVFYFPERLRENPLEIFYIWSSLSSYGGFFGGTVAALIYLKKEKLPVLPYCDTLAIALVTAWFFGRMGCSVAHDHPGSPTSLFFGVNYPGGPHHDLGFEEWVFTVFLVVVVFILRHKNPRPGVILTTIVILYAPVRFMMDYSRTVDKLYFGFTPGQYFSAALFLIGVGLLAKLLHGSPAAALAVGVEGATPAEPEKTKRKNKKNKKK
jgi:phosphatidylglycerol:prolipoprotein diacylglycerol transferase